MSLYIYTRVSPRHSKAKNALEVQIETVKMYCNAKNYAEPKEIFKEIESGKSFNRKAWEALMKAAKKGDRIVFETLSTMSTSKEGADKYYELSEKGIELDFVHNMYLNTENHTRPVETIGGLTQSFVENVRPMIKTEAEALSVMMDASVKCIELKYREAVRQEFKRIDSFMED